jgi:hypothetical protein
MSFSVKVDLTRAVARLDKMPLSVRDALALKVTVDTGELLGRAKSLAGGDVLQVHTGKYLDSIKASTHVTKRSVTGDIHSNADQVKIFEYGGKTGPHEILPTVGKALAFMSGAGKVFAASVHHPGSVFPGDPIPGARGGRAGKYSTLWRAYRELAGQLRQDVSDAIDEGLKE